MISNLQIEGRGGAGTQLVQATALPLPRPKQLLFNRELSLIEFFRRVLDQALDEENPLLERLRFLGIFSHITDEFFMIRVSALKEELDEGWIHPSPDGITPAVLL